MKFENPNTGYGIQPCYLKTLAALLFTSVKEGKEEKEELKLRQKGNDQTIEGGKL